MMDDLPNADGRARTTAIMAWLRLVRVFQKVDRAASEQLASHDLSVAQFDILAQLGAAEGITQQELADRLLVTKGNVSQLLAKMEQRGLVTRCQSGRANALHLTLAGRRLRAAVLPDHERRIAEQFSALSPRERRTLLRLLRKLDHALE
jgi:DNA-binding MarR family transcriptional regulator